MNRALVRKIEAYISKEPRRINMEFFGNKYHQEDNRPDLPPCGTVGCIAGWAVLLGQPPTKLRLDFTKEFTPTQFRRFTNLMGQAEYLATKLLGITTQQANTLFFLRNWPLRFLTAYRKASTPKGRATVVKRVLEYALAHNGDLFPD